MIRFALIAALAAFAATPASADDWTLNGGESALSFGSIKKGTVGEIHSFGALSGGVDADGKARLEIAAASLETNIDIRNERILAMVLKAADNPTITYETRIDMAALEALPIGGAARIEAEGTLSLAGVVAPLTAPLYVVRAGEDRAVVVNDALIMLDGEVWALSAGIEALREVAKLDSIAGVVPVSLRLVFDRGAAVAAAEPVAAPAAAEPAPASQAAMAGDPDKGKRVFNKCKACHVADSAQNKTGPTLQGVFGRAAGAVEGFKYSSAMKESGIAWTDETLAEYLRKPKDFIPGNRMAFSGLRKDSDIDDLLAYLHSVAQ